MKLRRALNILILLSIMLVSCSDTETNYNEEKIVNKDSPIKLCLTTDRQQDPYRTKMFHIYHGIELFDYFTNSETENNEIVEIIDISKDKYDIYKISVNLNSIGYSSINLNYPNFSGKLRIYTTTNSDRVLQDVGVPFKIKERTLYIFAILQFDNGDVKHLVLDWETSL